MKNLENVKALNDMEMAMVAGGNFFSDLEDVLRNIFTNDANPTQQDNGQDEMRLKNPELNECSCFNSRKWENNR